MITEAPTKFSISHNSKTSGSILTYEGRQWDLTCLNNRVALNYQDTWLIFWDQRRSRYWAVDGNLQTRFTGECLADMLTGVEELILRQEAA